MMKWKVVRNARCASADRSLERPNSAVSYHPHCNDSNNNEQSKKDGVNSSTPTPTRQELSRKPSVVASDCINLKGILGLSRQRSETNISHVGLGNGVESRRSRSEVRGASCDRLTIGYHHSNPVLKAAKTRSSSPSQGKSGWLRGRKRERGKTVVASSSDESRTVLVESGPTKKSPDDIVYAEIDHSKMVEENRDPNRVIRKKGMAPKPQVTNTLFSDQKPNQYPKPSRKAQTLNGRPEKPDKSGNNKSATTGKHRRNSCETTPLVTIAEVHQDSKVLDPVYDDVRTESPPAKPAQQRDRYHIDTPDYSTLDSEVAEDPKPEPDPNSNPEPAEPTPSEKPDETEKKNSEPEPIKRVRFESFDTIETYTDPDEEPSYASDDKTAPNEQNGDCNSEKSSTPPSPTDQNSPQQPMTVNVVVKNEPETTPALIEPPPQDFVVKKSFVLTIAKQEKGFKSLCATKKQDPEIQKNDHQISVTFLCSGPSSGTWINGTPLSSLRLRSVSVPPNHQEAPPEVVASTSPSRSRSRERRSKDRQNCKKNHKSRKKDTAFHMPQAVIDELSQVLEKRRPSPDELVT